MAGGKLKKGGSKGKSKVGESSEPRVEEPRVEEPMVEEPRVEERRPNALEVISKVIYPRATIKERQFVVDMCPKVREILDFHGLNYFTRHLDPYPTSWVLEFFITGVHKAYEFGCKAGFAENTTVQSVEVSYEADAIKRAVGLAYSGPCAYYDIVHANPRDKVEMQEVANLICLEGVTWTNESNQKATTLKPEAKILNEFVRQNITPNSHGTSINKKRALLLYAMMKEPLKPIDFAGMIQDELAEHILDIALGLRKVVLAETASESDEAVKKGTFVVDRKTPLIFPSVITALCKHAGLVYHDRLRKTSFDAPYEYLRGVEGAGGGGGGVEIPPPAPRAKRSRGRPPAGESSSGAGSGHGADMQEFLEKMWAMQLSHQEKMAASQLAHQERMEHIAISSTRATHEILRAQMLDMHAREAVRDAQLGWTDMKYPEPPQFALFDPYPSAPPPPPPVFVPPPPPMYEPAPSFDPVGDMWGTSLDGDGDEHMRDE